MTTAQPYDVLTQGAGALNVEGAHSPGAGAQSRRAGRQLVADRRRHAVDDDRRRDPALGQNIIWGDNIVSGDAVYYNRAAWANNIVWGDNIVWGGAVRATASSARTSSGPTTSCGAAAPTGPRTSSGATTSCGAAACSRAITPRRRQHRLGRQALAQAAERTSNQGLVYSKGSAYSI